MPTGPMGELIEAQVPGLRRYARALLRGGEEADDLVQDCLERAMGLRDLELGLAQLPPEQREVLLLVCLEEWSYQQVAEILGLPIGTVMSRLHRARDRMLRWLDGERRPGAWRRVK